MRGSRSTVVTVALTALSLCCALFGEAMLWPTIAGAERSNEPGVGATLRVWQRVYGIGHAGRDGTCRPRNDCFGPAIHNDTGTRYRFTDVSALEGLVWTYTENFPDYTPVNVVEHDILETMPGATAAPVRSLTSPGGGSACGEVMLTSGEVATTLKALSPDGEVGVEFASYGPGGVRVGYSPNNVQRAWVLVVDGTNALVGC
jgi:hypothetical protein